MRVCVSVCVFVCVCVSERGGIAHKETDKRIQNYKTGENERDTPWERERVRARKCVFERKSVCERERECVAGVDAREEAKTKERKKFHSLLGSLTKKTSYDRRIGGAST